MTRREQIIECMRAMDEGMLITGTADHISQVDVPRLLWWMCKAIYLLLKKEVQTF